jgi:adenylyltransferase/sulfurtransferase
LALKGSVDTIDSLSYFLFQQYFVGAMENIDHLQREIAARESELAELRERLAAAEQRSQAHDSWNWPLKEHEYQRYGRQMIVPGFGLDGLFIIQGTRRIMQKLMMRKAS